MENSRMTRSTPCWLPVKTASMYAGGCGPFVAYANVEEDWVTTDSIFSCSEGLYNGPGGGKLRGKFQYLYWEPHTADLRSN